MIQQLYHQILDSAPDAVVVVDAEGRIELVNVQTERLFGYRRDELIGNPVEMLLPESLRLRHALHRRSYVRQPRVRPMGAGSELLALRKDGSTFPVEISLSPVETPDGLLVISGVRDITERKRAENRFRALLESAPDAMVIVDRDGIITLVNAQLERLFGFPREELIGSPVETLLPHEFRENHTRLRDEYFDQPRFRPMGEGVELLALRKDGSTFPVEISLSPLETDEGLLATAAIRDISLRKRNERRLAVDHHIAQTIATFNHIDDAIPRILQYLCWTVGWTTSEFWLIDSRKQVATRRCIRTADPESVKPFHSASFGRECRPGKGLVGRIWNSREPVIGLQLEMESSFRRRDEALAAGLTTVSGFPVLLGEELLGVLLFLGGDASRPDSHECAMMQTVCNQLGQYLGRRRSEEFLAEKEEEIRQSQKMNAIGLLAGGVAHDFNNHLMVIRGCAECALLETPAGSRIYEYLEEIQKAGESAAALTRQLLAFGRRQALNAIVFDLNELVRRLESLLARLVGEDIELAVQTTAGECHIEADPSQIEQILMNLAINARDAMPGGGRLTIRTQRADASQAGPGLTGESQAKNYVLLSVSDTGCGMDTPTRQRALEPFFTTKGGGKGTGMGLAMVYGIVNQSRGHIRLTSQPNLGTTVKVFLPLTEETSSPVAPPQQPLAALPDRRSILLVEDEEAVLRVTRRILEVNGYDVVAADSPERALELISRIETGVDLLLTDVIMPGMSGPQLADSLKSLSPRTRVLFMSAYSGRSGTDQHAFEHLAPLIEKPFTHAELTRRIREVLEA